ncbi:hypothetical protein HaLaN_30043 [Haematococcus lacustris]|uniref:Uncharacterized protein n=1 Tax=Haematococcus lacustris TaxID=44745 RepID=A0A6A0AEG1_HAELA|nr:hypothetical protein HaLaN_30043 [Haematococcus lacustris]
MVWCCVTGCMPLAQRSAEGSWGSPTKVWGGGGLIATSPQPLSDPTAAADAHARVEQPKRRGWSQR